MVSVSCRASLEFLFETTDGVKSRLDESFSNSNSERKDIQRTVPSTEKLKFKKMGTRVDLIVAADNIEEDKANDDNTSIIEKRHFKICKEMKDILWYMLKRCDYDKNTMRKIVSLDITTFKFEVNFDLCDLQHGYVASITRFAEFEVLPAYL